MERKRWKKEPDAETPLRHVRRATSISAWTNPPAKGQHAREGVSDPSAGRDGKSSSWMGAGFAMNPPGRMPDVLKRYSLALVLAGLALLLRGTLPLLHGTAVYQLPLAAVILSAWYGGRGPGLLTSLICVTGSLYWFLPPVNSFELSPDYRLAFFIFVALCLFLTEFGAGRRRAEHTLRAGEERFRTFLDVAADALMVHTQDGTVVDVNRHAYECLGYTRQELIGMKPAVFDAGLDETRLSRVIAQVEAGDAVTFETQWRRKDGTVFPVEVRGRQFRYGARWLGISISRDISERKQAEERTAKLAAIVESSDDAIISKDLNGMITTWNTGAERLFGYAAHEVIGQSVAMLMPPGGVDEVRGILERIRSAERVDHFETVRRRKDGTLVDISLTVSPIIDGSGNVVGASKVARDISERKRAEERLREKDAALETARTELARVSRVTTLGELTTSIAHEVVQPLAGMIASAAASTRWLAAEPPDLAEARSALDNVAADGKRAREVIARIRALTKRQTPRKERLDVNHEALEVLALTERELRGHDIVLRTQLDRTLPRVAGDRVQLQQVLINLIMNAIEAMSGVRDRPRELTIVSGQDGPKAVRVEVRDSGTGLGPKDAEQAFEAFYTTKVEGIGIGLSISRSIVEAHGGRLWASPNEPHGAVFRFSLPVPEEALS
jgi:PAS domain S-box-containing protein